MTKDLVTVETQSIDYVPSFAVTLEEAAKRLALFQEFVKKQMVEGEDYGTIPGTSKPTLLKPGAEKLCNIFGFAPQFMEERSKEDWEEGFFYYAYKCSLFNKRMGQVEAECVGSANSKEDKYLWRKRGGTKVKNPDPYSLVNTLQKMAQKRALIGAVLMATRASSIFTQDIEDMDIATLNGEPQAKPAKKAKKPLDDFTALWSFAKEHEIEDKTVRAFLKEFDNDPALALPQMKERLGFDDE